MQVLVSDPNRKVSVAERIGIQTLPILKHSLKSRSPGFKPRIEDNGLNVQSRVLGNFECWRWFVLVFFRFEAGELQRIRSIDEDEMTNLPLPDQVGTNLPVLRICILSLNADLDPDPGFQLNANPDSGSGSQTRIQALYYWKIINQKFVLTMLVVFSLDFFFWYEHQWNETKI